MKTKILSILASVTIAFTLVSCDYTPTPSSDHRQQVQQEQILQEATSSIGMPAIHNFREKRLLKDILELRDQDGLLTYTYIVAENTGKLIFLGQSIGYGIPAATQFTNPQKIEPYRYADGSVSVAERHVIAQADPNGLFSPTSAEGTWVMLKNPNGGKVLPTYIEPRIIVSPFPLSTN